MFVAESENFQQVMAVLDKDGYKTILLFPEQKITAIYLPIKHFL